MDMRKERSLRVIFERLGGDARGGCKLEERREARF